MTSTNNSNIANSTNQPQSRTDHGADANKAPARQDYTASAVFDNDKVSSQQVEGLTDTDELSEQLANSEQDIDKNPENALNEQSAQRQSQIENGDGSAGNQGIREAVDHLNQDKLKENLLNQDQKGSADNPVPFSPD
ncbi:hypothetical protein ACF3NA_03450 [Alkanindiges sp. WGS2144]|uniref:hypothetical protein n=1 Tax=Alkanindiges sp. WGS2144 TaxID=3366808 RepID=UPI003750A4D3